MRRTDSELVQRTLTGDSSAFDELAERYRAAVLRLARRRLWDADEAMDVAQDAFVHAYMSLKSLRDAERFGPWLLAIAGNLCRMRLRGRREVTLSLDAVERIASPLSDNSPSDCEALRSLPDGARAAALLFFVEGFKQTEIAEKLGISLAAVKARIRSARAHLRKEMQTMDSGRKPEHERDRDFSAGLTRKLELARWFTEFARGLDQGETIMRSLNAILQGDHPEYLKQATTKVMHAIYHDESTLADALASAPELAGYNAPAVILAHEQHGDLQSGARMIVDQINQSTAGG